MSSDRVRSVALVAGARPNFVKIAPILRALDGSGIEAHLIHTGQHYDRQMSGVFFDELGIRPPDHSLGIGSGTFAEQVGRVLLGVESLLSELRVDAVVVVGDVNSTVGAALAAAQSGCILAHVEAGLRSHDWSMPEEINRVVTDRISDVLYAPSTDALANLQAEGVEQSRAVLVGNVMVDSLLYSLEHARERDSPASLGLEPGGYGVVTLHRPALVDDPRLLAAMVGRLERVSAIMPLVWPIHPRTRSRLASTPAGIRLIDPLGYLDFLSLQSTARLVITDSGGIQEETTVLGVPCLTVRDNTERPITVSEGTNRLVGTDPRVLIQAVQDEIDSPTAPRRPALWDGRAAERIVEHLVAIEPDNWARPTDSG